MEVRGVSGYELGGEEWLIKLIGALLRVRADAKR